MEQLKTFWNIALITLSEENIISIGDVFTVVLLVLVGYLFSHLIGFFLARKLAATKLKSDAIIIIKRISFYVMLVLIGLTILSTLGIPITVFAFATGAIAIGIGFGAQNIINNFISGWILIAERPIRIKDFIEIDGALGVVEHVGTRSTRICRVIDGVHILVPNSKLLENNVVNWTLVDRKIRTSVRVGVAYGSDIKLVRTLLQQAVNENTHVLKSPQPEFIFEDFGDNALVFDAYFWCDVTGDKSLRSIRSTIRFRISALFEENGIVIAFPQRDIHFHANQPIPVKLSETSES